MKKYIFKNNKNYKLFIILKFRDEWKEYASLEIRFNQKNAKL